MFRRKVMTFGDVLNSVMRENGLETPLNQKRLVDAWDEVVGPAVSAYTQEKFIKNQTLFVKIASPSLRADLNMMRTDLMNRLNAKVGVFVIADIRIY